MSSFTLPKTVRAASFKQPKESGFFIDTTTADVGYVTAGYVGERAEQSRLKFQVIHGDKTYNYDMPLKPTQYPINMGSGKYTFRVMSRVEGNVYTKVTSCNKDVHLRSVTVPYAVPNIFCNYKADGFCSMFAFALCLNCKTDIDAFNTVVKWVSSTVSYDYKKAHELSRTTGYIPDPEATLRECKGVCFDYASLTAALLRCVGIPCKVVTGWIDGGCYHSWVSAYVNGKWYRCDPTLMAAGEKSKVYEKRFIY